jgi:3-oxoacyl-[acyl-carrier protein] reductase
MAKRLNGKSAVVTGGGAGLGRAVALALVAEGAGVVISDINKQNADGVVAEIKQAGGEAVASYDNVASMEGGQNIVKTAVDRFGRIDILVTCAGNFKLQKTLEITEADWDSIMTVHTKGHFACAKAALPEMIKQKTGRIVSISSRAATFGTASLAYNTAKAGVIGFALALSEEFGAQGITSNVILPSADTQLFPGPRRPIGDNMPMSQDLSPDCIAPVIAYLATDEAKDVNGQLLYVSGGDICIYARPLQLPGQAHILLRKPGRWTVDELCQVIPPVLGGGWPEQS